MKKLLSLVATILLCCLVATPCFASSTPAVQVYYTSSHMNSAGGVEPTIGWKNTSGKNIKYVDWYLTAYNRVGDPVSCDISGKSTIIAESVGPITPYTPVNGRNVYNYRFNGNTPYGLGGSEGDYCYAVSPSYEVAAYFSNEEYLGMGYVLTDDEVQNALYDNTSTFEPCWYNYSINDFRISKAIVTFMDGSKATVSGSKVYSPYYGHSHANKTYGELLAQYSAVYNQTDYIAYNQDVYAVLGGSPYALMKHFIVSGMKEGRQGSSEFNLDAYKANNPDLVALFGDDNVKYYEHYLASGKAEGRKAT